ncbi:MAG: hypothetical protein J0L51_15085 [Rhizobiales bacterium]|nr:hypothetical protein [Hyphomicrobiales bacterium]
MASRKELLALGERCEKATGPDREIDATLDLLVGGPQDFFGPAFGTVYVDGPEYHNGAATWAGGGRRYYVPVYTASLDAITALIERKLPGYRWTATSDKREGVAAAWIWQELRFPEDESRDVPLLRNIEAEGATGALALAAAVFRTLAERA